MIPVKAGLYSRIDFSSLDDRKYADLLEKEYRFCQKIQDGILTKASQIYTEQKKTGVIHPIYCNFAKLESACDTYNSITDWTTTIQEATEGIAYFGAIPLTAEALSYSRMGSLIHAVSLQSFRPYTILHRKIRNTY